VDSGWVDGGCIAIYKWHLKKVKLAN